MDSTRPFYPELQRYSPIRSLSWRWDRAQALVKRGCYLSRRRDDEETGRALHYLRASERCRTDRQRQGLAKDFPDVHVARQLHEEGGRVTVEIQASLLARQSPEVVSDLVEVPEVVVRTYEALFFNILDRLDAKDWISIKAVRWFRFDPARGRDQATVLRALAYHGEPFVLVGFLPYLLPNGLQAKAPLDSTSPEGQLDRLIRLIIGVLMLPWTEKAAQQLVRIHTELLTSARQSPVPGSSVATLARRPKGCPTLRRNLPFSPSFARSFSKPGAVMSMPCPGFE